jgi:flagellar basal-body rod modification protein FlgD
MATVDPLAAASASSGSAASSIVGANQQLGETDFLMLLVTELMNQDPLDPLADRDFIAQMAQLNTLNQTVELNEGIRTMQMLQAAGLVGRAIEAIGPDGERVVGVVTEVRFIDSEPWLVVNNEVVVSLNDTIRVS